tara:strand:- start:2182 stop:2406 length:225 start_codon:yes stop_codon:yes gene_type:complete
MEMKTIVFEKILPRQDAPICDNVLLDVHEKGDKTSFVITLCQNKARNEKTSYNKRKIRDFLSDFDCKVSTYQPN